MALPARRTILVVIGIALVTVPLWAPALDVTGRDYEYQAAVVTVEDDRINVPADRTQLSGIGGIDCFEERFPSRRCAFEAALLADGPVRADHPSIRSVSGNPPLDSPEQYVAFTSDGRVFERTANWNGSTGAFVLDLQRVNASQVLADASRPVNSYDRSVRQTVATGSAQADEPLPEPTLVRSSDRYYVVYTASSQSFLSEQPFTERVFSVGAVLVGLLVLREAWGSG